MRYKFLITIIIFSLLILLSCEEDLTAPEVNIIYPAEDSKISGATYIRVQVKDNDTVAYVQFYINDVLKGVDSIPANSIYEYIWDASREPPGVKIISAKAYDPKGNVGEAQSIKVVVEQQTGPTYHHRPITQNTIWLKSQNPHIVTEDIEVKAKLTIEPGVVVRFDYNRIEVIDGGDIVARGTTDEPILWTSDYEDPEPGDWGGIMIDDGSLTLQNCIVEYTDEAICCEYLSDYQSVLIDNCIIRFGGHSGISLKDIEKMAYVRVTNTVITRYEGLPVLIYHPDLIQAFGPGNNFSGNENDAILVYSFDEVSTRGTWYDCGVPYLIVDDLIITGGWQAEPPVITIMPNTILKFDNSYLKVEEGTLIADGRAGTIVFTAAEDTGDWKGIIFSGGTNNYLSRLNNCIIQNAQNANIFCDNSTPRISDNEICFSHGWGMILHNSELNPDTLLKYNRFHNNDSGNIKIDTTPIIGFKPTKMNVTYKRTPSKVSDTNHGRTSSAQFRALFNPVKSQKRNN